MKSIFQKIGGRKFILVLIVAIVSYLFLLQGSVAKGDFVSLAKMLLVAYPASAVGQTLLTQAVAPEVEEESIKTDYRKFFFTLLIFALTCDLLMRSRIDSAQFMDLCQWLVGLYLSGNVLTKFTDSLPAIAAAFGKKT